MSRLLKSKVLDLSIILRLFSAFGLFLSVFVVIVAQILHKEGAWLVVATPPFWWLPEKRNTHTGFTNDNKTIMKTITFGIKNGPCETLFFFFSSPFPFLFPVSSFTLPFPSPFLFPVLFPFLFRFLFHSFSFRFLSFSFLFPFLFLSFPFLFLSFPLPFLFFPFPSFTIFYPFPLPRSCEFFDQGVKPALGKTIRGKNKITSGNTIWKGSGFLQTPTYLTYNILEFGSK